MSREGSPPRIIVTTSRRPSPRTRSLVKDLVNVIPGAIRLTRGHLTYKELSIEAATMGADRVLIIGEKRGNPSIIRIYTPQPGRGLENIVTLIVKGAKLAREAGIRGPPGGAEVLLVETDGSDDALDIAEAVVRGLHARLTTGPRSRAVKLHLRGAGEGVVLASFTYNDKPVGPQLKLGKPSRMIKDVQDTG